MSLSKSFLMMEDYRLREKSLRTAQYGLQLLMTVMLSRREAIGKISSQISLTRIVLRFFDDCSALYSTLAYGFGRQDKNLLLRILNIAENVAGQLYLPVEHYAFAQDFGLLSGTSEKAWKLCIYLWAISLFTAITRSLLKQRELFKKMPQLDDKNDRVMKMKFKSETWLLIMNAVDLLNALHFLDLLPYGKRLTSWKVGLLGLISSIIGLVRLLKSKR